MKSIDEGQIAVDVQIADGVEGVPDSEEISRWIERAAAESAAAANAEISVRIVDEPESQDLNKRYRDRDRPTNVLSFPAGDFVAPAGAPRPLGDIVICAPVVLKEAQAQGKSANDHWAHLLVHGFLHLLGHDHEVEHQAEAMESLERRILASGGVSDPY